MVIMVARQSADGTELASEVSEAALVEAMQAGEPWAFERFIRIHGGRVKAVAERYLRNQEDAHDVVQETFIAAFKAIGAFEGKAQLSTWLHRIAINAALRRLRTLERRHEEDSPAELEGLLPEFAGEGKHSKPPKAFGEAPEAHLMREEVRTNVRAAIDQLPEKYRVALLLRDIDGLDYDAVAEHLEVSANAAKIRVHRARQALRTLLERHFAGTTP